ncbi:uncharacterized protein LOC113290616 [Papaver somniferum]|uniref:uncharacterized protein LOC113290616 n=1 Tax=Papaver somniferum TaxID=3469 RepID=UPI000E6F7254|nr:uncharacterized protein LOC113290616 [Papaver somniferum]
MTSIFHDLLHHIVEVYVDDIVVKNSETQSHESHLKTVFEICRKYQLKMNPLKCTFGVTSGNFLGFVVTNEGIQVDPTKVEEIMTIVPPTNTKELQVFIGQISYIRRFVPGLAQIMSVFLPLLRKGTIFKWEDTQQVAFEKLKQCLVIPQVLKPPIKEVPLYLYTAFTSSAIGVILAQYMGGNELSPIYYRPKGVRGQAIADLMAMFPRERDDEIHDRVPGEVDAADFNKPWTMFFNGSSYDTVGGDGVVFEAPQGELFSYSFKLDFPYSNNVSEYEAFILGLRMAKDLGLGGVEIKDDSRLVTNQVNGDFHVKEPHLAPYRAEAQNLVSQTGSTLDHTGRGKNKQADALTILASKIQLNDKDEGTVIVRRKELPSTWKEDMAFEEADDWRRTYIDDLTKTKEDRVMLTQTLKQFVLIRGALYYRAAGWSLSRCMGKREAKKILQELHVTTCVQTAEVHLYK